MSRLPHANVTTVTFHFDSIDEREVPLSVIVGAGDGGRPGGSGQRPGPRTTDGSAEPTHLTPVLPLEGDAVARYEVHGCTAIADVRYRDRVQLAGRVRSVQIAPQHDAPVLELVLDDGTAAISVVFLGRRGLAGVGVGSRMVVEGAVGLHRNRLALLNPTYELRL